MVKHGWLLLIAGGLLSVPVGLDLSVPRAAAIAMALVAALGPLLILVGYDAIADRSGGGAARSGLQVAGLGLLILAGTEIASVVLPFTHDTRSGQHVATAETIAFILIALGSLVASLVLFRRWLGIALPLLIGAGALGVILAPITTDAQPAFGVWALSCVLLGVALRWTR
jgi:hypothetical protein